MRKMSCITVWRKGNCATKSGEKEKKLYHKMWKKGIISQSMEKRELYHKYGEKELYHKVWRKGIIS